MSWNFDYIAEDKEAAKAEVHAQGAHMPDSLKEVIFASIDEQDDHYALHVKSQGHIGGKYEHNATFSVRPLPLIRKDTTTG